MAGSKKESESPFWDSLAQDLRYAFRTLSNTPSFTAAAIATLALGIGANTALFSIVNAVLLKPLPYADPQQLVMVWDRNPQTGIDQGRVSPADYADWRNENQVFSEIAFSPAFPGGRSTVLQGSGGLERIASAYVSASWFSVLKVNPILGRAFSSNEDQPESNPVALLSYGFWQRRYLGAGNVLGQLITTNPGGGKRFTIVGVMPRGFQFPEQTDIWFSAGTMGVRVPPPQSSQRCCAWFEVIARLKPGVSLEQAQFQTNAISSHFAARKTKAPAGLIVNIVPLRDQLVGAVRRPLIILLSAVACLLLIACLNVANLLLVRGATRRKEIALRIALGASRSRIIRQLVTESVLLAAAGGAVGTMLAAWGINGIVGLAGGSLSRFGEIHLDPFVLAFTSLVSLSTGLLFGLLPAIQTSRTALSEPLKEGGRGGTEGVSGQRLRHLLVLSEVAIGFILLTGAGLFLKSFHRLLQVDPGFHAENVVTASLDMSGDAYGQPGSHQAFFQHLMERIRALPRVQAVGGVLAVPLSAGFLQNQPVTLEGHPFAVAADSPVVDPLAVTPEYFRTMSIPLRLGRVFTDDDGRGRQMVAIVNEKMAKRYWPGDNPVGKRLVLGSQERYARRPDGQPSWIPIVGVVADVRSSGLGVEARPELYFSYWQYPWTTAQLVVRASGDPLLLASAIRDAAHTLDKHQPITQVRSMEQIVADSLAQPRFHTVLLGLFSLLALMLAAVGIYGVVSYSAVHRTHEIGIRLALGAHPSDVCRLVLRNAMATTGLGLAIGVAGALALQRLLAGLLFGVSSTDPATFVAVALLFSAVALIASAVPVRRAMRVEPLVALRHD